MMELVHYFNVNANGLTHNSTITTSSLNVTTGLTTLNHVQTSYVPVSGSDVVNYDYLTSSSFQTIANMENYLPINTDISMGYNQLNFVGGQYIKSALANINIYSNGGFKLYSLSGNNFCIINQAGIQLNDGTGSNFFYINSNSLTHNSTITCSSLSVTALTTLNNNLNVTSTATVSTLKVQNNIDMNQSVSAGLGTEVGAFINLHWNFRNGRVSSNPGICLRLDSRDASQAFQFIYQPANGNETIIAQMNTSGTLTQSLSDEREKKNIIPLDPLKSFNKRFVFCYE